jgi:hypothetical protein
MALMRFTACMRKRALGLSGAVQRSPWTWAAGVRSSRMTPVKGLQGGYDRFGEFAESEVPTLREIVLTPLYCVSALSVNTWTVAVARRCLRIFAAARSV